MSKTFLFFLSLTMGLFAFPVFSAPLSVQTFSNNPQTEVSGSCAILKGYSSSNNHWFELKERDKNMTPLKVGSFGTTGYFQSEATRLNPDTVYGFRAVAQNGADIAYGSEFWFTTKSSKYTENKNGGDSFSGCSKYVPMTTNETITFRLDTLAENVINSAYATSYDPDLIAYYSEPIVGFTEKTTTNPTSVTEASYQKISQNATIADNTNNTQNNTASVALTGNSHSIFPKTFSDWFTIIFLIFMCVLGYFSWVFYQQRKEEELEYATVPAIFAGVEVLNIPQKPISKFPIRKFVKDPFFGNDKSEIIAELTANTVKNAPPDNLPV